MQWNNRIFFCSHRNAKSGQKCERQNGTAFTKCIVHIFNQRRRRRREKNLFVIVTCGSVSMLFQKLLSLTFALSFVVLVVASLLLWERNMMPVLLLAHFGFGVVVFCISLFFFSSLRSFWYCWLLFPSDSEWILLYNMQCSFGCHENFKIFVCIILFVYDCVFLIFYFQLFSRGFCGRDIYSNGHSRVVSSQFTENEWKISQRKRERRREIKSANIMIWWFALCWWNGINETQFNI